METGQERGKEPTEVMKGSSKQVGETQARWAWVEPCAWTQNRLTALEKGVKGGQWFSLIDKVWDEKNLWAAFRRVKANQGSAGIDHIRIKDFEEKGEENIKAISRQLREGTYRPQPVLRRYITKPGSREKRPLGVSTVRDRVVKSGPTRDRTDLREGISAVQLRISAGRSCKMRRGKWSGCWGKETYMCWKWISGSTSTVFRGNPSLTRLPLLAGYICISHW